FNNSAAVPLCLCFQYHHHSCALNLSFLISLGPLGSRAAKAIGFIEKMIEYSYVNAPLQKELLAEEVGNAAAFLVSPLASAITGSTVYVDNGLNTMALAVDSPTLST
uniref:Uncharacterized protein n=1 Tax=Aegilops tauschii subsp. strangulata TaxID=200361 RepID=A0A453KJ88_AEGTS